jgi:8-oxo-dGTP pyrophosphatase MutT (NUDIX family)
MSDATTPDAPRPLRHAATMIVLREHAGEVEVLMTRRHADLAFMGGMWVFPGGALAPADESNAARKLVSPAQRCFPLQDLEGSALPQSIALALAIAACRETFEETGVLPARRADGSAIEPEQLARLQAQRAALAANPALFVAALVREDLRLDLDSMIYWAHWVTPSGVPRRFDTRFFVTRAPARHEHAADAHETTECVWMTPRELLAKANSDAMRIAQPTRYNLEDLRVSLARHRTLDALLRAEAHRMVAPIMPKLWKEDGRTVIVMPWNEAYSKLPGEGVRPGQHYEPALLAFPSKIERDH